MSNKNPFKEVGIGRRFKLVPLHDDKNSAFIKEVILKRFIKIDDFIYFEITKQRECSLENIVGFKAILIDTCEHCIQCAPNMGDYHCMRLDIALIDEPNLIGVENPKTFHCSNWKPKEKKESE